MEYQQGSDQFWIEAQFTILMKRLFSAPLKEPAIQQQSKSWCVNYMATSGDGPYRTVEGESHDADTPFWRAIRSQAS